MAKSNSLHAPFFASKFATSSPSTERIQSHFLVDVAVSKKVDTIELDSLAAAHPCSPL